MLYSTRILRLGHIAMIALPLALVSAAEAQEHPTQTATEAKKTPAPQQALGKILFLGNSITLHGPRADVGWAGNWGMAASAADKDYVHIVTQAVARSTGKTPTTKVENIATFEREYATFDVQTSLRQHLDFKADVIVLAIGENVAPLATDEMKTQFRTSLTGLLTAFKANGNPTIYVRSCFWPDPAKDTVLKAAAEACDCVFVDMSDLGRDEKNMARSERTFEHDGVAGHPGDRGMQGIADALITAMGLDR